MNLSKNLLTVLLIVIMLFSFLVIISDTKVTGDDADNDGLDDDWESENGYDNTTKDQVYVVRNDTEDDDNDGLIDSWERTHGWDPDEKDNPLGEKDQYEKEEAINDYRLGKLSPVFTFIFVMLLSTALFSIAFGAFAARYGQESSRKTGVLMVLGGVLVFVVFLLMSLLKIKPYPSDTLIPVYGIIHWSVIQVMVPAASVLGAAVGALLALSLFLVVVMKS